MAHALCICINSTRHATLKNSVPGASLLLFRGSHRNFTTIRVSKNVVDIPENCHMANPGVVALVVFLLSANLGWSQPASGRFSEFEIASAEMHATQSIWVRLPENYREAESYPVLYLLDADGHFNYTADFLDYLAKPYAQKIPATILVGIRSKSPAWRFQYFTPDLGVEAAGKQGEANGFIAFLEKELIPEIAKRFKTNSTRILVGHSLAGLLTLYALCHRPALFQGAVAVSPSLTYAEGKFLTTHWLPYLSNGREKTHLYFSVAENDNSNYLPKTLELKTATDQKGPPFLAWTYELIDDTDHYSTAPAAIYRGILSTLAPFK